MPNPKDHFSTVVLGGKIYAMGGEHGHDQLHLQQSDMWVYDPATNAWKQLANMLIAKSHDEGGTFVSDGKIVMAGGQIDNFQPTAQVMSYDPAADAWSTLPNLPVQRQGAIIQRIGSKMVLTLGGTQTDTPQAGTWIGQLP
jgi:N-acetylneuraminic acid mutarotase